MRYVLGVIPCSSSMHAVVGQGVRQTSCNCCKTLLCFVFMQICDDELSALKGNNKPHPAVKQFYSCGPLSTELVTPGTPEPLIGLHLICYRKKNIFHSAKTYQLFYHFLVIVFMQIYGAQIKTIINFTQLWNNCISCGAVSIEFDIVFLSLPVLRPWVSMKSLAFISWAIIPFNCIPNTTKPWLVQ